MSKDGGGNSVEETDAERALAEVSAKKWQDYQNNFVPLENQYIGAVENLNSEATKQRNIGNASSQVYSSVSGQNNAMSKQSFAYGLDPTSGGFKTKSSALSKAIQKTAENAKNNSEFSTKNAYIQGMGNIVAMGNNQDTSTMRSMGSLASQSAGQAINDARNDFSKYLTNLGTKGAAFGVAAAYGLNGGGLEDFDSGTNQVAVRSGLKYNTDFGSEQSKQLADQEKGFGLG